VKIAILINNLGRGGAERVVQTLANAWVAQGHEVVIATLHNDAVAYELDPRVGFEPLVRSRLAAAVTKIASLPMLARQWRRFLTRHAPTHAFSLLARSNLVNCLASARSNLPAIVSERTTTTSTYSGWSLKAVLMRRLIRRLYPRARTIIAISGGVKSSLELLGIGSDRIVVIPNPQDLSYIRRRAQETASLPELASVPRLVTVGRLIAAKDHRSLLEAFRIVLNYVPAQLVVVGDGPLEAELKQRARDLRIAEHVWWAGWQQNPFAIMRQCHVYAHSSRHEAFGNTIVEAMACGLPVVATDCGGGIAEMFCGGLRRFIVPVGDPAAMAEALLPLMSNRAALDAARLQFEGRADAFSVEKIAEEYLRCINVR
jgi:glycosyltransferase involved in cell wall biosynthesis